MLTHFKMNGGGGSYEPIICFSRISVEEFSCNTFTRNVQEWLKCGENIACVVGIGTFYSARFE